MAQRKFVRYKKNTIICAKGMTKEDVIEVITKRMEKRKPELQKRLWIVLEYKSLEAKQKQDQEWLNWVEKYWDETEEIDPNENKKEATFPTEESALDFFKKIHFRYYESKILKIEALEQW